MYTVMILCSSNSDGNDDILSFGRLIRREYALIVRHVFPREWTWTPIWLSWISSSCHRHCPLLHRFRLHWKWNFGKIENHESHCVESMFHYKLVKSCIEYRPCFTYLLLSMCLIFRLTSNILLIHCVWFLFCPIVSNVSNIKCVFNNCLCMYWSIEMTLCISIEKIFVILKIEIRQLAWLSDR